MHTSAKFKCRAKKNANRIASMICSSNSCLRRPGGVIERSKQFGHAELSTLMGKLLLSHKWHENINSWQSGIDCRPTKVTFFCYLGIAPRAKMLKIGAWLLHPIW